MLILHFSLKISHFPNFIFSGVILLYNTHILISKKNNPYHI